MDRMAQLGLMFLAALVMGKLVRAVAIPKVTGFILAGFLVGPSGAGWIGEQEIGELALLSRLAIALILFDIGGEFDPRTLRREGSGGLKMALVESAITFSIVSGLLLLAGAPAPVAVVLGVIAIETSPSATILVVKEAQARGPVTSRLLAVVAGNVVLALTGFQVAMAALGLRTWPQAVASILGAALLGAVAGALLGQVGKRLARDAELLLFALGLLLVLQGACRWLGVSAMTATLVSGTVAASVPQVRHRIFDILRPIAGLLYAVLFVLAGARVHLDLLMNIGWMGLAYLAGRTLGKLGGGSIAARAFAEPGQRFGVLPLALVSHAGVALGLTMNLAATKAEIAPTVTIVVLSAIVAFEIAGPIGASVALKLAGEAGQPTDNLDLDVLDEEEAPTPLRKRSP